MGMRCDLAMCAIEFARLGGSVHNGAWMACHFSTHGDGLSNLPPSLPADTLLILDDSTPMDGHDASRIVAQLASTVEAQKCNAVLLDFERPPTQETRALVAKITASLPCPVAVSQAFASQMDHAVFLPPVPPDVPLARYIAPWRGREIWLELAPSALTLTLTPNGCLRKAGAPRVQSDWLYDARLCCHYCIQKSNDGVQFFLARTGNDLRALLTQAEAFGIKRAVGLYQELAGIL